MSHIHLLELRDTVIAVRRLDVDSKEIDYEHRDKDTGELVGCPIVKSKLRLGMTAAFDDVEISLAKLVKIHRRLNKGKE